MAVERFLLPDVGEGLTEADIVTWHVAVGDQVEINQIILEIETAKSLVDMPSPYAGVVTQLLVEQGATVPVGTPVLAVDTGRTERPTASDAEPEREPVLVGYGPTPSGAAVRRRRYTPQRQHARSEGRAKPPVRKLAADRGVDIASLHGTGPDGLVTREDVLLAHPDNAAAHAGPSSTTPGSSTRSSANRSTADPHATRIPVRGVRRASAAAVTRSAFTAPHVTEFLTVDVTPSTELLDRLRGHPAFTGLRVTMLLLVARAVVAAVEDHPDINASWDEDAGEIVQHHALHLGIAAATPRGLLVPVLRDADRLGLPRLARAIGDLAATAREGRTPPEDLTGSTLTVTNIGVFGIDAATPILNPGEAAILCTGAVRRRPWEHQDTVALRSTMTLSLSFDHRLVDGELGSRFLHRVGTILADPAQELLLV